MNLLLYSDYHFLDEPSPARGVPPRLEVQERTAAWIAEQVRAVRPEIVVNAGDTNHLHGHVGIPALDVMARAIRTISQAARRVGAEHLILAGNHDQADRRGRYTVLPALAGKGVTLVTDGWCSPPLGAIAHQWEAEEFTARARDMAARGVRLLVIHQDLQGAAWNPQRRAEVGLDPKRLRRLDFERVFAGHYHHPQTVRGVCVVGSVAYYDWNDYVLPLARGVVLYRSGKVERLANPHAVVRHTVRLDRAQDLDAAVAATRQALPESCPLLLRVKCPDARTAKRVRKRFRKGDYAGVAQLVVSAPAGAATLLPKVQPHEDQPEETLRAFVREKRPKDLDAERLVAVGLEALADAPAGT
jgi:DNA repair exonuclease SbcCD nuclease subunit